jgi:hypothetical protein
MVDFVASCLLGAWSTLLVYESPPEWLGTAAFTWVAGGIVEGTDRRRSGGKKLLRRLTLGASRVQSSVKNPSCEQAREQSKRVLVIRETGPSVYFLTTDKQVRRRISTHAG